MCLQIITGVLGLVLAVISSATSAEWTIETIDSGGAVGKYTSIAVGSSGDVHISYYDISEANLKYATNESGAWVTTVLDSSQDVGRGTSIQLDTSGRVHISYFYNYFQFCPFPDRPIDSHVQTKYATNTGGSWVTQLVWGPETCTTSTVRGTSTSLSVDRAGAVHVASDNPAWEDLVYSSNASGGWTTQRPKPTWKRTQVSLSVDTSGYAHITYYVWELGLRYMTNLSGAWEEEVIDSIIDNSPRVCCNWGNSLELDTRGLAHISYYDSVNSNLKYATNSSGTWITKTIDDAADVGRYNSIAFDSNGLVHIAYYDATNRNLKYVTNASGTWNTQVVDTAGDVGRHNSIAVDGLGIVHISYYDLDREDLKYAYAKCGGGDDDGGGGGGCFIGLGQ